MANFELQANSRIIRDGRVALSLLLDKGLSFDDFKTSEGKGMFQHLLAYYTDIGSSGSLPGINAARILFPNFELCDDASMSTDKLFEELRRQRQVIETREVASYLAEMADVDPMRALAECQSRIQQLLALGASKHTDIPFESAMEEILYDYELIEAGVDLSKMSWPWPALQDETGGLQEDDYIVLYGRPKSKKSWVLSAMIAHAYLTGKNVLVYTKEMTPKNIMKRVAACIARVPYRELRRAQLGAAERANFFALREYVEDMKMSQRFMCLSGKDVPNGGDTIPWLGSKVEKYKPDVMFVDALYLMNDASGRKNQASHEKMTNISRQFRALILETKTPGVATLQANRKAAGHANAELDEIAYSDAIGQDATIAARVISEHKTIERPHETIALVMGGTREFELHGLRIHGIPAIDFSQHSIMSDKETSAAKVADSEETAAKTAAAAKKRSPVTAKDQKDMLAQQLAGVS